MKKSSNPSLQTLKQAIEHQSIYIGNELLAVQHRDELFKRVNLYDELVEDLKLCLRKIERLCKKPEELEKIAIEKTKDLLARAKA